MNNSQTQHQILIRKYLKGIASADEEMMLLNWINEKAGNEVLFDEIKGNWETDKEEDIEYAEFLNQKWSEYQENFTPIKTQKRIFRLNRILRYAAIFILTLGSAATVYFIMDTRQSDYQKYATEIINNTGENNSQLVLANGTKVNIISKDSYVKYNEDGTEIKLDDNSNNTAKQVIQNEVTEKKKNNQMIVPNGHQALLTLSDGTKVWLNAGSKLIFPSVFEAGKREVFVEGEAFFDVTKNPEKPFIVVTKGLNIQVFGTSFNVMAYPDEEVIETVLVTGKVQLERNDFSLFKKEKVMLHPGQYAGLKKNGLKLEVKDVDVESFISWKQGWYKLDKLPLSDVVSKLERYYNIKVVIIDKELELLKITGKLDLNANLNQVMDNLAEAVKIRYKIEQNTILIRKR
jgi:ferric-dicitrate binding protein FerR (iron transport regulator)